MQAVRLSLAAAVVLSLAACERPKFRGETERPTGPQTADSVPAAPAWAAELLGKPLRATFPTEGTCVGNTDSLAMRYLGPDSGVRIEGWGWDPAAKAPVQRVVLVDGKANIVGAGETGLDRPDVPQARPEVTSSTTGWSAVTGLPSGALDTYGLLADGASICKLGHIEF